MRKDKWKDYQVMKREEALLKKFTKNPIINETIVMGNDE